MSGKNINFNDKKSNFYVSVSKKEQKICLNTLLDIMILLDQTFLEKCKYVQEKVNN